MKRGALFDWSAARPEATRSLAVVRKALYGWSELRAIDVTIRSSRCDFSARLLLASVFGGALFAMPATPHSLYSSYREMLLEHLFAGEVMKHVWLSGLRRMEVLKPQVDDGGYDLVLEAASVVRHVQLKATYRGSTVRSFKLSLGLAAKPSGCVVCVQFCPETLELGPFFWLGGAPGKPLPSLVSYPVARHTKGNSAGVKLERPNVREVPRSAFEPVSSVAEVVEKLFGPLRTDG